MHNDRAFAIFATTLLVGVASIAAASIAVGYAAIPLLVGFVAHWAMSLGFRASYKSLDANYSFNPFAAAQTSVDAPSAAPVAVEEEKLAA